MVFDVLTDNSKNIHRHASSNLLKFRADHDYALNRKFVQFKATIYVPECYTENGSGFIKLISDGEILYHSPEITKDFKPIPIDLDFTDRFDFQIEFSHWTDGSDGQVIMCIGDCNLVRDIL